MLYWGNRIWVGARRGKIADDPVVFAIKDKVSRMVGALLLDESVTPMRVSCINRAFLLRPGERGPTGRCFLFGIELFTGLTKIGHGLEHPVPLTDSPLETKNGGIKIVQFNSRSNKRN